jgi:hypothetical protein
MPEKARWTGLSLYQKLLCSVYVNTIKPMAIQNGYSLPWAATAGRTLISQHDKTNHWLNQQMKKLLPTHYFLLTITLP